MRLLFDQLLITLPSDPEIEATKQNFMHDHIIKLIILSIIILLINLPFGFLRGSVKKFSFKWFLYIHLPIPLIILLRIYSDIGFALYTYPIFVFAYFMGQTVGRRLADFRFLVKKVK